ncbi:heme lyase CcmF/NrfE family subunit [Alteriqipengyuania lutimaris]|uniref:Heme lyase CcmF/NrfE family subunit n=1 Tax=Alteriqipengyuania lutimaris TaxID=1538146 RepID=A0A395LS53_9SPHN|nr:heme lyase CcmF/NrfE family subunit [Alteriqipengyuania lutimaris]MBB3032582.1 cytochrome c-type biogenesis protein CcmF [Alteriqipengyuania lutimaris]RDS78294.1 heme lyase CcmF/NrfE family subunit [Alteriqipengyuania lutimaris]
MIAEVGLAALWLAMGLCVLQLLAGASGLRGTGAGPVAGLARPAAIVQGLVLVIAFACLLRVFVDTDLSVALVAANSHTDKPLIYRLSGAWGNHEGSMLMWVTILGISGALVAAFEQRMEERFMKAVLAAQAFVALGFLAFLLFSSNPFERLDPPAAVGAGLNPLLQDIGLALHPPILYVGYVGLSVAFCFVVAGLLTRQAGPELARVMRPWVLAAWVALTLGIAAGSYWAYYELGWGGWWFWDPVENASLLPWLAATALLHSVSVLATRDALRTWTILLGVVAFSMSMIGTFLVRSGILTSVHTFAVDPERGAFILVLLTLYIGGAFGLFAWRAGALSEGKRFAAVSREGALVFNNVMLSAILAVVLLGTLYPILTEAFDTRVSIGPPYYNPVTAVFAVPMFLALLVGPLLRWKRDSLSRVAVPLAIVGAILAASVTVLVLFTGAGVLAIIGLAIAAALALASWLPLRGRRLKLVPLALWGSMLAHFGIAVSLAGMASESAFSTERLVALRSGDSVAVGPYEATLAAVEPVAGPNWTALQARITVSDGGRETVLQPEARYFTQPEQSTSESALMTRWNGQFYAILGDAAEPGENGGERWQLRLWWKPFVTLIWYGGILIALGGILSIFGHLRASARRRKIREEVARRRAEKDARTAA